MKVFTRIERTVASSDRSNAVENAPLTRSGSQFQPFDRRGRPAVGGETVLHLSLDGEQSVKTVTVIPDGDTYPVE
jgi:hypothetical protein